MCHPLEIKPVISSIFLAFTAHTHIAEIYIKAEVIILANIPTR